MHKPIVFLLAAACLGQLSGCANTQIASDILLQQQAETSAANSKLAPEKIIIEVNQDIHDALLGQLQLYAPLHIESAQKNLLLAEKDLRQGEPIKHVLEYAYKAQQLISDAYKIRTLVASTLSEAYNERDILLELEAHKALPLTFQTLMKALRDLVVEVEGGFVENASSAQATLLASMQQLRIDTLKKRYLSDIENLLEQSDKLEAKKFASQTYQQAQAAYLDLINTIEQSPLDDYKAMATAAQITRTAVQRTNFIARESAALTALSAEEAERQALYIASLIEQLAAGLGEESLPGQSYHDHVDFLLKQLPVAVSASSEKKTVSTSNTSKASKPADKNTAIAHPVPTEKPIIQ